MLDHRVLRCPWQLKCSQRLSSTLAAAQVYMEQAMQLGGELVFTVRKAAPIRLTQAQVQ